MSLVPEEWNRISRTTENGRPACVVARQKTDVTQRLTAWKLVKHGDVWYSEGQWISEGRYRRFPEKRGVRLSDSKLDKILRDYAEGLRSNTNRVYYP